jgi:hypothetical protein
VLQNERAGVYVTGIVSNKEEHKLFASESIVVPKVPLLSATFGIGLVTRAPRDARALPFAVRGPVLDFALRRFDAMVGGEHVAPPRDGGASRVWISQNCLCRIDLAVRWRLAQRGGGIHQGSVQSHWTGRTRRRDRLWRRR